MKDKKGAPGSTSSKSKKASSRVTAAKWEAPAEAVAARRRAQRQAIQAHIGARGRRQQARRDSR